MERPDAPMRRDWHGGAVWWGEHIAAQERSGLGVREYCDREGLSRNSFYWWRRRLAGVAGSESSVGPDVPLFVEVKSAGEDDRAWEVEIESPSGWRIRAARGAGKEALRRAVEALEGC